ncbi:MAG: hypothetical protein C0624_10510 [Desulfuromonas sp.]|nr:MAG: hypothetical protein C0624_10510 [Desulfuromonas sp.]
MMNENLIHKGTVQVGSDIYEVLVFLRHDGRHVAKTFFAHEDVLINDASSLEEALEKHQRLLPLAIDSRRIVEDFRHRAV